MKTGNVIEFRPRSREKTSYDHPEYAEVIDLFSEEEKTESY